MKFLELKLPPVLLVFIIAALMWLVAGVTPSLGLDNTFRFVFVMVIDCIAVSIAIAGVIAFRRAKTTVNPTRPDSSSTLVNSGIYQLTRNPMYLGLALFLLGFGVLLNNLFAMLLVPVFMIYMTVFQIRPEENALLKLFGEEFEQYRNQTRRWL